jgi:hypothetical protein
VISWVPIPYLIAKKEPAYALLRKQRMKDHMIVMYTINNDNVICRIQDIVRDI